MHALHGGLVQHRGSNVHVHGLHGKCNTLQTCFTLQMAEMSTFSRGNRLFTICATTPTTGRFQAPRTCTRVVRVKAQQDKNGGRVLEEGGWYHTLGDHTRPPFRVINTQHYQPMKPFIYFYL